MDAGIAGSGNINSTAATCLVFSAYLSRLGRADERTRTAFLLITSDNSCLAGGLTPFSVPGAMRV